EQPARDHIKTPLLQLPDQRTKLRQHPLRLAAPQPPRHPPRRLRRLAGHPAVLVQKRIRCLDRVTHPQRRRPAPPVCERLPRQPRDQHHRQPDHHHAAKSRPAPTHTITAVCLNWGRWFHRQKRKAKAYGGILRREDNTRASPSARVGCESFTLFLKITARPLPVPDSRLASPAPRLCALSLYFCPHDLRRDSPVLPRFLRPPTAHRRALRLVAAGLARTALHQRRHESLRALLPRRQTTRRRQLGRRPARARYPRHRHPEMHPRRRQTQRPRGRRLRHLPPHPLRDARQLVLRRLLQKRVAHLGLGTADQSLGHPAEAPFRHRLFPRQIQEI